MCISVYLVCFHRHEQKLSPLHSKISQIPHSVSNHLISPETPIHHLASPLSFTYLAIYQSPLPFTFPRAIGARWSREGRPPSRNEGRSIDRYASRLKAKRRDVAFPSLHRVDCVHRNYCSRIESPEAENKFQSRRSRVSGSARSVALSPEATSFERNGDEAL